MPLLLPQVVADIEAGRFYSFAIKPKDEDKQTYFAPTGRQKLWRMMAYCYLAKGPTAQLLKRLKSREGYEGIEVELLTEHSDSKTSQEGV